MLQNEQYFFKRCVGRRLEKNHLFCSTLRQMHSKLEQKSLQIKSEISNLGCERFLFQQRRFLSNFKQDVKYNKVHISDI